MYTTTKQKADTYNSFQFNVWTHTQTHPHTHTHTSLPNASYLHVFMVNVRQSSQI